VNLEALSCLRRWPRRGEEGRRRAEQRYAWDTKIEQVLRLYRHILDNGHGVEVT
jgi:glycosyltransferase involved in cell wall biosynthesis